MSRSVLSLFIHSPCSAISCRLPLTESLFSAPGEEGDEEENPAEEKEEEMDAAADEVRRCRLGHHSPTLSDCTALYL